jgi:D-alanine-D-alanine ligase
LQLAILFGGESFEHEISIISAITIKKLLQNPIFIFLNDEQDFYLIPSDKMEASYFSSGSYKKEKKLHLIKNGFKIDSFMFKSNIENLKILNLIHGGQGENGEIFSLFNFYKIPIISPNREASILSYNKKLTKIFANSVNVKTLDYEILEIRGNRKIKNLQYPIIVKPLNLGSSLGVSVVKKA